MKTINRTGEEKIMNCGEVATIINYKNYHNIVIEFKKYNEVINCDYGNFKIGKVESKYIKNTYGVGFIGEGKFITKQNGRFTQSYIYWFNMLKRVYDNKFKEKETTYQDCTVCEDWLCFQNFAKWFEDNYYEIDGQRIHIDKDILNKGNKIYAPENCVFVPQRINNLFTKRDKLRGEYPIGVTWHKKSNKFISYCSIDNRKGRKHLGCFENSIDAFYKGYKPFKENYIKEVADEYKDKIPTKLYDAMYKYEVEMTD